MATQVERDSPERDERDDVERDDAENLPDDGGFARLELPGFEPSER